MSEAAAILASRPARLFIALAGLFITNAIIAEFVGVKIFALEDTLGVAAFDWRLFGQSGSLSFTAGVMLWPIVFILTDVINEHYGVRGVRLISWLAVGFISYAFLRDRDGDERYIALAHECARKHLFEAWDDPTEAAAA